jgi:hypothetical protein
MLLLEAAEAYPPPPNCSNVMNSWCNDKANCPNAGKLKIALFDLAANSDPAHWRCYDVSCVNANHSRYLGPPCSDYCTRQAELSKLLATCADPSAPTPAPPAPIPPAPTPNSVDVFVPGMKDTAGEEYECIRIPSIVFDANHSTLVAFAECRHNIGDGCIPAGAKTKPGGTNLCSRVSTDGGASWGALVTLAKNAGQPTATYDRIRQRIVLEFNSKSDPKCLGAGCCPNFQLVSSDGGASWSPKVSVSLGVTQQARAGPGVGIQLSSTNPHAPGRLVNIGYHYNHSESTSYDTIW